ncbi:MAG: hypothetical protein AAGF26_19280 [Cyanobacteria bacterium P01_G01_bin.49]
MNSTQNLNSSQKIPDHQNLSTPKNEPEPPIDAEIIAETSINFSPTEAVDTTTINLICQPVEEEFIFEETPQSHDSLPLRLKNVLTPLTTPWGLASLSLIVVSNLMVGGVELWNARSIPTKDTSAAINSPKPLPIPESLNLARKSSDPLVLGELSTVSVQKAEQPPISKQNPSPDEKSATPNVVNVNQPLSLTNAILPPSLQPQISLQPQQVPLPNQEIHPTPLPVPSIPKKITPPPVPVSNIPRPVPPSVKPSTTPPITIEPPPLPSNNGEASSDVEVSKDEQVRQVIQKQLQMEENNQTDTPLGYSHKTRLELQNGVNEVPNELMPRQVNQLEQLQQRQVIDSVE